MLLPTHFRIPLVVSLLLPAFLIGCASSQPTPPNIIVIMADDLGYGDISTFDGWVETPHLDQMAAEGMLFTDFHSSGPVCSPTRAGLLTGRYQQRAGLPEVIYANPEVNRHHGLQTSELTFAEVFREAGYATGVFGKWHLGYNSTFNPLHHGFDEFRGYVSGNVDYISHIDGWGVFDWWEGLEKKGDPGYVTHLITRDAVNFIEAHHASPFLLYIAHEAPHYPFQGPNDPSFRIEGERIPEAREPEQVNRAYREMVEEMDTGIGEVLAALKEHQMDENTLVLFFSDNGAWDPWGSNGELRGYKSQLWEGGHRVPAIAWWPGRIEAGTSTNETAITIDIMPTIMDVAGLSAPEGHLFDGLSLADVMTEQASLVPRTLFWEWRNQSAVREGPWKLTVNTPGHEGIGLFNLVDDLGETTDLSESEPSRVAMLKDKLEAWRDEVWAGATEQPEDRTGDNMGN